MYESWLPEISNDQILEIQWSDLHMAPSRKILAFLLLLNQD
jgi:hypothetical protein